MKEAFPFCIGTVHIIGIGGIGMSGYAEVLHQLGYKVQGSDATENANVLRLKDAGVRVLLGHSAKNIYDAAGDLCSVVVRSTAVKDDNVEVMSAIDAGVPVIPRVELLAEIMRSKWCINISGTHGKTTTTSILGHLLAENHFDPTIINGGIINAYGSNTRIGKGDWMVVEADESDGTFSKLPSVASIITNIDQEHMDYYKSFDNLKREFVAYAHKLPFYGFVVACSDHPVVRELIPLFERKTITYGENANADVRAVNIRASGEGFLYDVEFSPRMEKFHHKICDVKLPLFGRHNVINSLVSFAVGHELSFSLENIKQSVATLEGVKRRFTTTGVAGGVRIIDDYAHHPVEIKAVIGAARDVVKAKGSGKIIAVIQPHRYTRLKDLFLEFAQAFAGADAVIVADVYAAGEAPIEGFDKNTLAEAIRKSGHSNVTVLAAKSDLAAEVAGMAKSGDIVLCLGAGDITKMAYALPQELEGLIK